MSLESVLERYTIDIVDVGSFSLISFSQVVGVGSFIGGWYRCLLVVSSVDGVWCNTSIEFCYSGLFTSTQSYESSNFHEFLCVRVD